MAVPWIRHGIRYGIRHGIQWDSMGFNGIQWGIFCGIYNGLMRLKIVIQWDMNGTYPLVICYSLLLNMANCNWLRFTELKHGW